MRLFLLLLFLSLTACVSMPDELRVDFVKGLQVKQVQENPTEFSGKQVRWGGTIVAVQNLEDVSIITVVSRPLDYISRPALTDVSYGRFLVETKGFKDPAIYAANKEITVVGKIREMKTIMVGQYPYPHPVLEGSVEYLWPERLKSDADSDYWGDPYYPYYYPWWYHRSHHH